MRGRAERRNGIGATGYLDRSSAGARGSGFGDLHLQMTSGILVHHNALNIYCCGVYCLEVSDRNHIVTGFNPYPDATCRASHCHHLLVSNRIPKFGLRPAITGDRASLSALSMLDFPDRSKPDPLSSSNPVPTAGRAACFRSSKAAPARSNPAPRSCPALQTFRNGGQPEYPLAVSTPMHCGPKFTPATTRSLSRPMAYGEPPRRLGWRTRLRSAG